MKIDFTTMQETILAQFKGGEKELKANMFFDGVNRIFKGTLVTGASIGRHTHETSSEIIYVLSGEGTMECEGEIEILRAGDCHYCKKGQTHTLKNEQAEDLVFLAVVPEQ